MSRPKHLEEAARARSLRKYNLDYKTCSHHELCDFYRQRTGNMRRNRCKNWLIARLRYLDFNVAFAFRFLDLPAEIRNQIYELILPYNQRYRYVDGPACDKDVHAKQYPPVQNRTALLRTCRQIHKEGTPIFTLLSTMTIKIGGFDYPHCKTDPRTHGWKFDGDLRFYIRERSIMGLYDCKQLNVFASVRNVTLILQSLHLGPNAWLAFFTFLAQTARKLKRLEIRLDTSPTFYTRDNWWFSDPEKAATTLSPWRKHLPQATLFYLGGLSDEGVKAVHERLGLGKCNRPGAKLVTVWNVMLCAYERVPRICLRSDSCQ